MTNSTFTELGLADPLLRALKARNHDTPTPIQAQAIPALLDGDDMLGIAQTGTGKTGAFGLPILDAIANGGANSQKRRGPRALILAPTRELAIQIGEEFRAYGKFLQFRMAVIVGGVSQKPQVEALNRNPDIIVATPGRLMDLMNQGRCKINTVETFVLDEADRMLDMGFIRDVRKIAQALPRERQSLLFSATMPREIEKLSAEILNDPMRVEVTPRSQPVERIEQCVYHVNQADKAALLQKILVDPALYKVIVFTRTKHRANRLARQLDSKGVRTEAIHGDKSQNARQRALKLFKEDKVRVLVATDIAARGIDVDGITHVVNFELPNESESYVHRIGRTARAGASGAAIAFCDGAERGYLRDIEKLIGQKLAVVGEEPTVVQIDEAQGEKKSRNHRQNRQPGSQNRNQNGPKRRRSRHKRPRPQAA